MFNKSENVIMSKIICNRFGFKLGDKVKLNDGKIDKNFTIVAMTQVYRNWGTWCTFQDMTAIFVKVVY